MRSVLWVTPLCTCVQPGVHAFVCLVWWAGPGAWRVEVPTAWARLITSLSFRAAPGSCWVKFLPQLGAATASRLWGFLNFSLVCLVL